MAMPSINPPTKLMMACMVVCPSFSSDRKAAISEAATIASE